MSHTPVKTEIEKHRAPDKSYASGKSEGKKHRTPACILLHTSELLQRLEPSSPRRLPCILHPAQVCGEHPLPEVSCLLKPIGRAGPHKYVSPVAP